MIQYYGLMVLNYRISFLREIRKIFIELSFNFTDSEVTHQLSENCKVQKPFLQFHFHEQQT